MGHSVCGLSDYKKLQEKYEENTKSPRLVETKDHSLDSDSGPLLIAKKNNPKKSNGFWIFRLQKASMLLSIAYHVDIYCKNFL